MNTAYDRTRNGICALCWKDNMSPVLDIPSRSHFSSEHIVMVMALCEGVHFHLSTTLITPFLLFPPPHQKNNNNLPHLVNQARQIHLIPHFSPTGFPPEEAERDTVLQSRSGLTCPHGGGLCFVSFQWHSSSCNLAQ